MHKINFKFQRSYMYILIYNMILAILTAFILKYAATSEIDGNMSYVVHYYPYFFAFVTIVALIRKDSMHTIIDFISFLICIGGFSFVIAKSPILILTMVKYKILPYLVMTIVKILNHRNLS